MSESIRMETGGDDDGPYNVYLHKSGNLSWSFAPNDTAYGHTVEEGETRYIRYDLHESLASRNEELVARAKLSLKAFDFQYPQGSMPQVEMLREILAHLEGDP